MGIHHNGLKYNKKIIIIKIKNVYDLFLCPIIIYRIKDNNIVLIIYVNTFYKFYQSPYFNCKMMCIIYLNYKGILLDFHFDVYNY